MDGIAVVVNPENSIAGLTTEQVRAIFTGEITNWSEVA
jgi:phosphate transport system substrate-binding protein